jgi:hypothetical protein
MEKLSLESIGSLFGDAWELYRERCGELTEILLSPVALLLAGDVLLTQGPLFYALAVLLHLVGLLLLVVAVAAVIHSLHHHTDVEASYHAGAAVFFPFIWLAILMGIALLGGTVMLVIPGIFLAVAFAFSNFVLVLEGKRGSQALVKSRAYAKGYWWAIFGRIILLSLCMFAVYLVIGLPFGILFGQAGTNFISTLLLLVIAPFSLAYYYTIYKNLKTLKSETHPDHTSPGKTFIVVAQIVGIIFLLVVVFAVVLAARVHGFQ